MLELCWCWGQRRPPVKEYGAAEPRMKLARRRHLLVLAAQWQGHDDVDETATVGVADLSEV
jgi:hypothetical protein